eukprot:4160579-Prorocentrum_lima.AAC.1
MAAAMWMTRAPQVAAAAAVQSRSVIRARRALLVALTRMMRALLPVLWSWPRAVWARLAPAPVMRTTVSSSSLSAMCWQASAIPAK